MGTRARGSRIDSNERGDLDSGCHGLPEQDQMVPGPNTFLKYIENTVLGFGGLDSGEGLGGYVDPWPFYTPFNGLFRGFMLDLYYVGPMLDLEC